MVYIFAEVPQLLDIPNNKSLVILVQLPGLQVVGHFVRSPTKNENCRQFVVFQKVIKCIWWTVCTISESNKMYVVDSLYYIIRI